MREPKQPKIVGERHVCPACRTVFYRDCLIDVGEYHIIKAKAKVITAAGYGAVSSVLTLIFIQCFTNVGINLNHALLTLLALLGLVIAWAFPRNRNKNGNSSRNTSGH